VDWLSRQLITQHAELKEERNLLDNLLLNLDAGVTYLDTDLVYRIVNPYFAAMFDRQPEDFIGQKLFSQYPETSSQLGPAFDQAMATRQKQVLRRFPLIFGEPNPRTTYWNTTITPVVNNENVLTGLLTLCFDVTDTVTLEGERRRFASRKKAQKRG
jgi:PAS domain-containing protein